MGRKPKPMSISDFARMGGKARSEQLSKEELSRQGKKAAKARWAKTKKKKA
jgi:hypothetical protein